MSFWGITARVAEAVISLGGSERLRFQTEKYDQAVLEYCRLRNEIAHLGDCIGKSQSRITRQVRISTERLRTVVRLLYPVGTAQHSSVDTPESMKPNTAFQRMSARTARTTISTTALADAPIATGVTVGLIGPSALWAAVQALGHASTGTAIASTSGAAASNASWAWFGGGSLATGGGGVALGHLVLPGIGIAAAVAVSATLTHQRASRLAELRRDIDHSNAMNTKTLTKWRSDLQAIYSLEATLFREDGVLAEELRTAYRALFPYRILSRIWRLIRYWMTGQYYSSQDQPILERLDRAAARFVETFRYV